MSYEIIEIEMCLINRVFFFEENKTARTVYIYKYKYIHIHIFFLCLTARRKN